MHREGHLGMALAVYAPIGFIASLISGVDLALLGAVVTAGLAMLPDIDMRIPFVKHRGITHTIWFTLVVGLLVGMFGVVIGSDGGPLVALGSGAFGFLVGTVSICSHLLADALTPAGIRPFSPMNDVHYTLEVTRASNSIANYLLLGMGLGVSALALRIASEIVKIF
jgi:inner membrane protein